MTILECLRAMQYPYSYNAIRNTPDWAYTHTCSSISSALKKSFLWDKTPEGFEYWSDYYNKLKKLHL